jgi:ATP-dependent 26S proteasome regulatory subunit
MQLILARQPVRRPGFCCWVLLLGPAPGSASYAVGMSETPASGHSDDAAPDTHRDPVFTPEDVTRFASLFTDFMSAMQTHADSRGGSEIATAVDAHLGGPAAQREPVGSTYPRWRWADVDQALDALLPGDAAGVGGSHSEGLAELIGDMFGNYNLGAVERSTFPTGHDSVRYVAMNALRFATFEGEPVIAYAHVSETMGEEHHVQVEVLAREQTFARTVLAALDEAIVRGSGLRGQIVSLAAPSMHSPEPQTSLVFHERPALTDEDVILPAGRLERIRATVLGMSERAHALRAAGQHLSRGVLLYGKTHTVRYLLSQAPQTTAFILQGSSLGLIREAAETARQLQPAIIVLEDADLVAADRDFSEGERPVLFEVLDVMDGLDDDADVAFVLTTNRVDVLEEALALRPGRIDLAVPIPLPTAPLRARLFARSGRELPLTAAGCEAAAEAAAGTTGSFPKEAVRRAVLDAMADGAPVDDARLLAAVTALRAEGEELSAAMTEDAEASADEWDDADWDEGEVDDRARGMGGAGGLLSGAESDDSDAQEVWSAATGGARTGDGTGQGDDDLGGGVLDDDELLEDGLSGEDLLDLDLEDD